MTTTTSITDNDSKKTPLLDDEFTRPCIIDVESSRCDVPLGGAKDDEDEVLLPLKGHQSLSEDEPAAATKIILLVAAAAYAFSIFLLATAAVLASSELSLNYQEQQEDKSSEIQQSWKITCALSIAIIVMLLIPLIFCAWSGRLPDASTRKTWIIFYAVGIIIFCGVQTVYREARQIANLMGGVLL